ncbi:sel1 repeat family protein [Serratia fonticola]|uniref:tetratricopeptide repeat protein n=1 Tax=Serratia fonticola TaxID=47917 RepID=UPI0016487120|nr:tetratricopeptide repeat protein [Serratia fonticola]MBC3252448.1 sel1 repeat family protein [Serratia fonticola]
MTNKYMWITILLLSVGFNTDAAPMDRILDSANAGNVHAQAQLGVIYATGNGTSTDLEEAKKWLLKAAQSGSAEAEYNLGVIYSDSEKTSMDYAQASYWFEQAAKKGNRDAQYNLGVIYSEGLGVKPNLPEAEKWFEKSVVNGTPAEQYELALLFRDGTKLPRDDVKALLWFEKAASHGHVMAQYEVGHMYGEGIGGERNYIKSLEWLHKSALQGNNIAVDEIAHVARRGLGWSNTSTPNVSRISTTMDEPSLNLDEEEIRLVFSLDETMDTESVTDEVSNKEADSNMQPIEFPEMTTITRCDDFSHTKDKLVDEKQDDNTVESSNEVTDTDQVLLSPSTTHHKSTFSSEQHLENSIALNQDDLREAHF